MKTARDVEIEIIELKRIVKILENEISISKYSTALSAKVYQKTIEKDELTSKIETLNEELKTLKFSEYDRNKETNVDSQNSRILKIRQLSKSNNKADTLYYSGKNRKSKQEIQIRVTKDGSFVAVSSTKKGEKPLQQKRFLKAESDWSNYLRICLNLEEPANPSNSIAFKK